jgi:glycosyltransferase involved in cell wall biosynthesis
MKISAIIPTFNRAEWLIHAVESVLNQSYAALEVIVVDDGSTDNTQELLSAYPVKFRLQKNAGPSAARNAGAQMAQGDWLAFLDSDDRWCPQKLQRQVEAHLQHPNLKISFTDEIWIRNGKRVNASKQHQKAGGWMYPRALELCLISPSSVMLSKELYELKQGFDEQLWAAEDYDLWLRICADHEVCYVPEPLIIKYGGHGDQLSSQRGIDRYRVMALEKMMCETQLSPEYRQMTLANLIERYRILGLGYRKHGKKLEADEFEQRRQYWLNVG